MPIIKPKVKQNRTTGRFESTRPSFLTEQEWTEYKAERRKFNDRVMKQAKRLGATTREEIAQLARANAIPFPMTDAHPTNVEKYNLRMDLFQRTKTKEFKAEQKQRIIDRNMTAIYNAYWTDAELSAIIEKKFSSMSTTELTKWTLSNSKVVKDYFDMYKAQKMGEGIDYYERNTKLIELLNRLDIPVRDEWLI